MPSCFTAMEQWPSGRSIDSLGPDEHSSTSRSLPTSPSFYAFVCGRDVPGLRQRGLVHPVPLSS